MAESRQSTMQRLQVGLVGLVVVLLLVSLANMALDRATDKPAVSGTESVSAVTDASKEAEAPAEPMAELGVAPVSKDSDAKAEAGAAAASAPRQR